MKLYEKYLLTEGRSTLKIGNKKIVLHHSTYEEEMGIRYGAEQAYNLIADSIPAVKKLKFNLD